MILNKNPGVKISNPKEANMTQYGSTQAQERLEEVYAKKQLEIGATYAEGQIRNQVRLELEEQKALRQEWRREMRRGQYSQVILHEDGELEVETKCSIVSLPKRKAANFRFLDLIQLKSVDGDGPIYVLFLKIGEKERQVYLDGEKVGRGEYLLKKITESGGQIFIDSKKKKAEVLQNFWITVCGYDYGNLVIPVSPGWITTGEKEYRFVKEGETLWETIIKRAK